MNPIRILIVDDDTAMREVLRRALEREGYVVSEAGNGKAALDQLAIQGVDGVVTDIVMPDSEGVELTLTLRKTHPKLPVIAMSGGGHCSPDTYLSMARAAGARHVLAKPFEIRKLLELLRAIHPVPPPRPLGATHSEGH